MLSPTVAQRLTSHLNGGFYMGRAAAAAQQPDQHSSWGSYAVTEHANGDGYLAEAGRVQSGLGRGHVAQDAVGNGSSFRPHQRNLSPELGRPPVLADGHKCPPPPPLHEIPCISALPIPAHKHRNMPEVLPAAVLCWFCFGAHCMHTIATFSNKHCKPPPASASCIC